MTRPPTQRERGYGYQHKKLRASLAPRVDAGLIDCWRCGQRIKAGEPWDLGHAERVKGTSSEHRGDHRAIAGPEHQSCNRATNGRERNANHEPPVDVTRQW